VVFVEYNVRNARGLAITLFARRAQWKGGRRGADVFAGQRTVFLFCSLRDGQASVRVDVLHFALPGTHACVCLRLVLVGTVDERHEVWPWAAHPGNERQVDRRTAFLAHTFAACVPVLFGT